VHAQQRTSGKNHAVLIGINKYNSDNTLRPDLRFADSDAIALGKQLQPSPAWGSGAISILTDVDPNPLNRPTQTVVQRTLETVLTSDAGPNDQVYIFISARGQATGESADGVIEALNSQPRASTGIRVSTLRNFIQQSRAPRIFIFADVSREARIGDYDNRINLRLEQLQSLGKVELILGSEPRKASLEDQDLKHGVFGYFLSSAVVRPGITLDEMFNYLRSQIEQKTQSRQRPYPAPRAPNLRLFPTQTASLSFFVKSALLAWAYPAQIPLRSAPDWTQQLLQQVRDPGQRVEPAVRTAVDALKAALPRREQLDVATALENEGQLVFNRYGTGDQFPGDPQQLTRGDFERAEAAFRAAGLIRGEEPELEARRLFCRGRAFLFGPADLDKAEADLRQSVVSDGQAAAKLGRTREFESPEAFNALGIVYLNRARYESAVRYFRAAIERAPGWAYPRQNLALARVEQGKYDDAVTEYRAAIQRSPYYAFLYYNLGLLYQRINRARDAETMYRQCLRILDDQAQRYSDRSRRWLADGESEAAHIAQLRGEALRRNRAQVWNALGSLAERRGQTAAAEALYRQAAGADPELLAAQHNLALALQRLGHVDEAIAVWQQVVAADGSLHVSRLKLAEAYIEKNDWPAAANQYRAILARTPENFEAHAGVSAVLARDPGSLPDAIGEMTAAIRAQTAQRQRGSGRPMLAAPEYYERLGDLYAKSSDLARACEQFQLATQSLRTSPYSGSRGELRHKMATNCGTK